MSRQDDRRALEYSTRSFVAATATEYVRRQNWRIASEFYDPITPIDDIDNFFFSATGAAVVQSLVWCYNGDSISVRFRIDGRSMDVRLLIEGH